MLPGESVLVSEWTGLPGRAKSVQRFERSNGRILRCIKTYLYLSKCHSQVDSDVASRELSRRVNWLETRPHPADGQERERTDALPLPVWLRHLRHCHGCLWRRGYVFHEWHMFQRLFVITKLIFCTLSNVVHCWMMKASHNLTCYYLFPPYIGRNRLPRLPLLPPDIAFIDRPSYRP